MKKLDDIPKKNVFSTPDGYFDNLPGIIQARIAKKEKVHSPVGTFSMALRYAIPVLAIGIVLFFVFRQTDEMTSNPERLLAEVSAEELTNYLVDSDFSTEELLDMVDLDVVDINALNEEILTPGIDDEMLQEYADDLILEL